MTASLVRALHLELAKSLSPGPYAGKEVVVVVPDRTRPVPIDQILPAVLSHVRSASRVRVLVGLGLHRPLDEVELAPYREATSEAGAELAQHDPDGALVRLSDDVGEHVPGFVHPWVVQCDRLVLVGMVEPHQYAGFSGGAKAVAIGCAGRVTIESLHSVALLRRAGVRLGRVVGNPFRQVLDEIVHRLPPTDAIQFVSGALGWRVFAGPLGSAFRRALAAVEESAFTRFPDKLEWLHLPVPEAKGQNFYQASRVATYAALVDKPVVQDGGWILVEAPCPEGLGLGSGELAFAQSLARGPDALREELEGEGPVPSRGGAQRAYVLSLACRRLGIALIGAPELPTLQDFGIPQFSTLEAAKGALQLSAQGCTWPHGFSSVPRL